MRLKKHTPGLTCGGFSLLEAAFGAAIVGIFFVALFALNSQCLYFVNSSRELICAGQTAQSRLEQLRTCTWSQITNASAVQTLLTPPMTGASSLGSVTEVVTVNAYPTALNPGIQLTRVGDGISNVAPTINSNNNLIANGDMVTITLQLTWTAAPAARSRSIAVSTVFAENVQ